MFIYNVHVNKDEFARMVVRSLQTRVCGISHFSATWLPFVVLLSTYLYLPLFLELWTFKRCQNGVDWIVVRHQPTSQPHQPTNHSGFGPSLSLTGLSIRPKIIVFTSKSAQIVFTSTSQNRPPIGQNHGPLLKSAWLFSDCWTISLDCWITCLDGWIAKLK